MSNEEANSLYKCTVSEYHALHKWDAGGSPSQETELQEMGVDGQGIRETGGSAADRIFFMKYPMTFLQHWYATYPPPQQYTTTTGSSVVSPSSADVDVDMTGDSTSALTDSNFPHMSPRKTLVFNWHTVVSSLQDVMNKYYEMFRGKNHPNWTDFFNRTEDSDTDVWTRLKRSWVLSEEQGLLSSLIGW